jgi:glycine/D-amino acid oxidase-like deaminating enzyme
LEGRDDTPKTSVESVVAAARVRRVRLAYAADDVVNAAGARAATGADREPVDGEALPVRSEGAQESHQDAKAPSRDGTIMSAP